MAKEVDSVGQRMDPRLEDPLALDEIELYGEVVIAASSSEGPLSLTEIDDALGLGAGRVDHVPRPGR